MAVVKYRQISYKEMLGEKKGFTVVFSGPWNRARLDQAVRIMQKELRKQKGELRKKDMEDRKDEIEALKAEENKVHSELTDSITRKENEDGRPSEQRRPGSGAGSGHISGSAGQDRGSGGTDQRGDAPEKGW